MTTLQLKQETAAELTGHLLPFWNNLKDDRGGFYGGVDFDLTLNKQAMKGGILNSRILWFYSNVFLTTGNKEALLYAKHAYDYLVSNLLDKQFGGIYWMLNADGSVLEDTKHTYCQAFAVYGLSSYYAASGDSEALHLAHELYRLIESRCTDAFGYGEAFSRDFKPAENRQLSEDGYLADKTMNTLLHVIEAYTELLRVGQSTEVRACLTKAMQLCLNKVYDPKERMLQVFFDKQMRPISDIYSYGHDIEATWLLDRACDILDDAALTKQVDEMNRALTAHVLEEAFECGALNNERLRGVPDKNRVWWVQAEGVVGFLNAYQRGRGEHYLNTALALWGYIKEHLRDSREGGEWYWLVGLDGTPVSGRPIVEPWKCPYHNGRMCMEVVTRCATL